MITLQSIAWRRDAWEVTFDVREGVYQLVAYPVRVTHLAYSEDHQLQEALGSAVTDLLRRHMRRGSVPPHAMVLDWSRVPRICSGGSAEAVRACRTIQEAHLLEAGNAVSNHF